MSEIWANAGLLLTREAGSDAERGRSRSQVPYQSEDTNTHLDSPQTLNPPVHLCMSQRAS